MPLLFFKIYLWQILIYNVRIRRFDQSTNDVTISTNNLTKRPLGLIIIDVIIDIDDRARRQELKAQLGRPKRVVKTVNPKSTYKRKDQNYPA